MILNRDIGGFVKIKNLGRVFVSQSIFFPMYVHSGIWHDGGSCGDICYQETLCCECSDYCREIDSNFFLCDSRAEHYRHITGCNVVMFSTAAATRQV